MTQTTVLDSDAVIDRVLAGARMVKTAVADETVGAAWDRQKILVALQRWRRRQPHRPAGGGWQGLSGHDVPSGPAHLETVTACFAGPSGAPTDEDHQAGRE